MRIEFDGSGDSGEIQEIEFYDLDDDDGIVMESGIEEKLCENLETWAYTLLQETVQMSCDWVNNEGGWGRITLDVEDKKYEIDYNQRTYEEHEWADELFKD